MERFRNITFSAIVAVVIISAILFVLQPDCRLTVFSAIFFVASISLVIYLLFLWSLNKEHEKTIESLKEQLETQERELEEATEKNLAYERHLQEVADETKDYGFLKRHFDEIAKIFIEYLSGNNADFSNIYGANKKPDIWYGDYEVLWAQENINNHYILLTKQVKKSDPLWHEFFIDNNETVTGDDEDTIYLTFHNNWESKSLKSTRYEFNKAGRAFNKSLTTDKLKIILRIGPPKDNSPFYSIEILEEEI